MPAHPCADGVDLEIELLLRDQRCQVQRHGGCVHKVILWAFEQQGLNATTVSSETVEGPGLPPNVDIYIADRRSAGKGGYWPVPLTVAPGQTPDWHAADGAA